jgi:hypothetical protein
VDSRTTTRANSGSRRNDPNEEAAICFTSMLLPSRYSLGQRLQAVLLDYGEQSQCHTTRLFRSRLPLLNRRFAGIKIAGEYRLADAKTLPQFLDLCRLQYRRRSETGVVESPHGRFANRSDFVHRGCGRVDCLESIALEFTFGRHCKFPSNLYHVLAG